MLIKIYTILQTKINNIRQIIQDKHPSRLGIFRILKFFLLEITLVIVKYFLILFKHPSESFKLFVNQPALAVCPYSYTDHKTFQKKIRVFSVGGLSALVGATIISSLLVNLSTGPIFQSRAATYAWNQTSWSGGVTSNNASHTSNQTGWTEYSAKDANLSAVNSGTDLQLAQVASSTTQTNDTQFNAGTKTSTQVIRTGNDASVILSSYPSTPINEYTIGSLTNISVITSSITGSGPWTIAFSGSPNLLRIFENDRFTDAASPTPKNWKITSVNDTTDTITVTDSESNGGSPTAGTSNVGRWYSTLQAWETARQGDLITRNAIEKGVAYKDGTFTAGITIFGSTTDANHYMWLTVAPTDRHTGTAGTGVILDRNNGNGNVINIDDVYTIVEWFEITNWGTGTHKAIEISNSNVTVRNCIIHDDTPPSGTQNGITFGNTKTNINIYNCIFYNITGSAILTDNDAPNYIYNNTFYNMSNYGISSLSGGNSGILVTIMVW